MEKPAWSSKNKDVALLPVQISGSEKNVAQYGERNPINVMVNRRPDKRYAPVLGNGRGRLRKRLQNSTAERCRHPEAQTKKQYRNQLIWCK
jgi:hypothetical protein